MPSARMIDGESNARRSADSATTKWPRTIEELRGSVADTLCGTVCQFLVAANSDRGDAVNRALTEVESMRSNVAKDVEAVSRAVDSTAAARKTISEAESETRETKDRTEKLRVELDRTERLNAWRKSSESAARSITARQPIASLEGNIEKSEKEIVVLNDKLSREKRRAEEIEGAYRVIFDTLETIIHGPQPSPSEATPVDDADTSRKREAEVAVEKPAKCARLETHEEGELPETRVDTTQSAKTAEGSTDPL